MALPPLPVLLLLVAVRSVAVQVFQPASRAALPALVAERDLETANSTVGFGTHGAEALGPRLVPDAMLGRVFGTLYGAVGVAAAISHVGGGLLLDATGAPITFVVAGTAGTLVTVAVALVLPRALARTGGEQGGGRLRP